ncbi:MAG TPA: RNA-binding protein, partial [Solibacterales bacterium]|nr:RNA-binding protein [Bryobacterales bacterium]
GAQVKVESGGLVQYDHVRAGGSFLSSNDPRLHFGLGERASVDRLEIRWPSGKVERFSAVSANRIVVIKEGFGIVAPADAKRTGS